MNYTLYTLRLVNLSNWDFSKIIMTFADCVLQEGKQLQSNARIRVIYI